MHTKKQEIVFVSPRMHTNEFGITKCLLGRRHSVNFHVNVIGKTESHDLVKPIRFKSSKASKLLQKVFGQGRGDLGLVFPSFFKYFLFSRKKRATIVFIKNPLRVFSIIALVSHKLNGSKVIFYSQSSFHDWSRLKWLFAKILVHTTDSVWVTPISNRKISQSYPKRFYYLPFVVNGLRGSERTNEGRIGILMVGKYISDRKNHKLFLNAFALLLKEYNIRAEIVGEVDDDISVSKLNALKKYAEELGIQNAVKFYSNIPFLKMREVYLNNDIFILPSSREPAAISPLEAMANGLAVICSDSCGTKTYVESCFPDLVFKSDSLEDLCRKITLVLSSSKQMENYKARSRECREGFSEDTYSQVLNQILVSYWGIEFEALRLGTSQ